MSGHELYKGKPIFYGIGNFCFDLNTANSLLWYNGLMVSFDFNRDGIKFEIIPYIQCKEKAAVTIIPFDDIKKEIETLNSIITDEQKLIKETENYYDTCQSSVANTIEPYTNRYLKALRRRGLAPNFLTKRWLMYLCNYTMCESHRDKLEYFFEHNIY
jgi:poly-gamma-glutamate synthesis protein (capsule biosynthesis protein)